MPKKEKTEVYIFVFFMFNKSSFIENELVFKNLNITQINIKKDDN